MERASGDRMAELQERQTLARAMGGDEGLARHRASGRLPVRERIALLIDPGSWFEIGALGLPELRTGRNVPGDAVVTGLGKLNGRHVGVIGIDASILAGTTAPVSMRKQGRLIALAQTKGFPLVLLCDADGGRIPDVMGWRFSHLPLDFRSFLAPADGDPLVPRAAAVLGPAYGDSALHAATAHFVVMTQQASIALVGPSVIEQATSEVITDAALGGPAAAQAVGKVHMVVQDEPAALDAIAAFLSFLPANSARPAPVSAGRPPATDPANLAGLVPADGHQGYDMRRAIEAIVDADSLFAWGDGWGGSLLACLGRIDGHPVGILASQPIVRAGALDAAALAKEHDFVDLCDGFNIPLLFLQDVPGLMVGSEAERSGILRAYEKAALRLARATVPKVAVVVRKAYGGGHFALGGRPTAPDFLFAWPNAELGFMAPETGVRTVHRRKLDQAFAAGGAAARDQLAEALRGEWLAESEPWEAAANLALDDVIDPAATREVVARAIDFAWGDAGSRIASHRHSDRYRT